VGVLSKKYGKKQQKKFVGRFYAYSAPLKKSARFKITKILTRHFFKPP
jgi:predicted RNA-binding protein